MKPTRLLIAFLFWTFTANAQTLEQMREKKHKAAEEIQYINQLLDKAQKSEKSSVNRLRLISNKINQRNNIIFSLNTELGILQELIDNNTLVVGNTQQGYCEDKRRVC